MKKLWITLLPFLAGLTCLLAYRSIGSTIAPDGTLVEPFYLIPMGYLFFGIGITFLFIMLVKYLIRKK